MKRVYHEFPPFFEKNSKILILGSIPSVKSREEGFYYAHPSNRFWKVLSTVLEEELPKTVEEKKHLLKKHHIALWDVLESCTIEGSSDQSIKEIKVNDITSILKQTSIKKIYTTGKKASDLYQKYILKETNKEAYPLPSTSAANGAYHLSDLIEAYRQIKD